MNFADKLASHAKKMTLMKFKNFIIYQVYNWKKNKIHIFYNIEINKKSIKKNEFISASDKRSDTQKLSNVKKLFIEHSTKSSIIFSDENENFNLLFDRLVFKTVKSSKQSKKRN